MTISKITSPVTPLELIDKTNEIIDALGTSPTSLGGLSDVSLTSASNGELLGFDGTNWVNTNKLSASSVGDGTTPIYLDGGVPTALSYTIESSVPANAVFTDTTYTFSTGLTTSGTTISVTDYAKLIKNSGSGSDAIGIGYGSGANSNYAIGLGYNAKGYATGAIQLGAGTNSTANSLSVGFYSYSTNWQLLDGVTGYIPDARLNMDSTPTSASTHTVTSGGVYSALSTKIDLTSLSIDSGSTNYLSYSSSNGKFSAKVDTTVGTVSTNLVTSGAVSTALSYKLSTTPDGTHDFLDSNNKININYLPDVVLGQMLYAGTFVPSTAVATLTSNAKIILGTTSNTIVLTNNTTAITGYAANEGNYYIASASGSFASIDFETGDWLVSTGSAWKKISNTDAVTGVKGNAESTYRTGNVNITADNVLPSQTGNSGKYLTTNGSTASWASVPSVTVDQTYDGTSANAQSGVAIQSKIDEITGGLSNYVTLDSAQNITGTKTFVGSKKVEFKQSTSSDKLGFTLYSNGGTEKGYLEYNPTNTVDNVPLMTLGNYGGNSTAGLTHIGFRKYSNVSGASGAYNLLAPLVSEARTPFSLTTTYTNFYLPLGFKNGSTMVLTAKTGVADLSTLFPTIATSVSSSSTNAETVGAKLFYDTCGDIEALINAL